jgi:hypothetical protein
MIVKPDDQVLDYFIYQMRVGKADDDIRKFFTNYRYGLSQLRNGLSILRRRQ